MPRLDQNQDETVSMKITGASNFHFSGVRPEKLQATEYTLVTIVIDETGSVAKFADLLLDMVKTIIKSCQKNARAENVLVRLVAFNRNVREVHGFIALPDIKTDDYQPFQPTGLTALYDATYSAIGSMLTYGKSLYDLDMEVNGVGFIVTDGDNNTGSMGTTSIADCMEEAMRMEKIKGITTVLIGIKDPSLPKSEAERIAAALKKFKDEAKLTEYIDAGDATPLAIGCAVHCQF